MDSNENDTEVPEDQLEEQALHLNAEEFVSQPKAKAKPQRKEPADSSSRIIQMNRRNWIDIQTGKHSLSAYEVSKKVIHLLRHSQQVHREEDGAVHFCEDQEFSSEPISHKFLFIGLTIDGKYAWKQEEEQKDSSTALMIQE